VQVNIGIENGLEGVCDLIRWKAYYHEGGDGENVIEKEIPEDMLEECKEKKLELLSCLVDAGAEELEENFLEENIDIPEEDLKKIIREYTIQNKLAPVFMGSAYKNKGV
jgi:elongation factor G